MISHDNILYESIMVQQQIPHIGLGGEERIISYLPLSHVAGMMVDIIVPMLTPAIKNGWCAVSFARPYDLKVRLFVS